MPTILHIRQMVDFIERLGSGFFSIVCIWLVLVPIALQISRKFENKRIRHIFLAGIHFKMLCFLVYYCIFNFYYKSGDTFKFYQGTLAIYDAFHEDKQNLFKILGSSFENLSAEQEQFFISRKANWYLKSSNELLIKFGGVLSLIFNKSYVGICFVLNLLAFLGSWKLFETIRYYFPENKVWLAAIPALFIPSVIFWSSGGLVKESLLMFFFGFTLWSLRKSIGKQEEGRLKFASIFLGGLGCIYWIKPYLTIALVSAIFLSWIISFFPKIKKEVYVILVILIIAIANQMGDKIQLIFNGLLVKIHDIQEYQEHLNNLSKSSGAYSFGNYWENIWTLILIFPEALCTGLFRPFLWESFSLVSLLASVESTGLFILSLFAIYRVKILNTRSHYIFAFLFSISLFFFLGLVSYNFGALSRYRIFALPLFISVCFSYIFNLKIK